ncbi:MAG TPA: TatD family hydrolase [Polyangiaceae bacterium]|nr:TatD family hydrolase [Polyangiaceae bacterium]
MWFDTHCHLDSDDPARPTALLLERARRAGVTAFVNIGVGGVAAMRGAVALAVAERNVWATVGVHPHEASSWAPEIELELLELLGEPRVVALGEVGLDYHYDSSPRDVQRRVFAEMVGVACRVNKPLVIHTRSAPQETLDILRAESAERVGGIIHCFSEDIAFARAALDLGFDISFSGIVTFKKAEAIQQVAAFVPSDRLLLETDSPYLSPVPLRGKPCEPAFLVHTARRVAELRCVELSDLARVSTENAVRRFGVSLELEPAIAHN